MSANNRLSSELVSIVITQYIMHKETPDSGTVSSVAYLAGKVSSEWDIVGVLYETKGIDGS